MVGKPILDKERGKAGPGYFDLGKLLFPTFIDCPDGFGGFLPGLLFRRVGLVDAE